MVVTIHVDCRDTINCKVTIVSCNRALGGISSRVLSVFFTDKFALSQSDARISVAYNSCR